MDDRKIIALYENRDQSAITKTTKKFVMLKKKYYLNILEMVICVFDY